MVSSCCNYAVLKAPEGQQQELCSAAIGELVCRDAWCSRVGSHWPAALLEAE